MKITKISWTNFKGLADGEILADGSDVIVRGRNGAGKSSIAELVPFVLFGKVTGSVKRYENGLTQDDNKVHAAEIVFEDGTTFRREYFWTRQGNTQNLFVNGEKVRLGQFKNRVEQITGGGSELVMNPFAFCALPSKDQRNLLTKIFGETTDKKLLEQAEFADIAKVFDGLTADCFIAKTKIERKNPKAEVGGIPWQVAELQRQLMNMPENAGNLETLLAEKKSERSKLRTGAETCDQKRIEAIERSMTFYERNLKEAKLRRENLLKKYHEIEATAPGMCPTCGQKIPLAKFKVDRDAELSRIVREGKLSAREISDFEKILSALEGELKLERSKPVANESQIVALDNEISELERQVAQITTSAQIRERIKNLSTREKELNEQIATLEGQLATAEKFQQRKIELAEEKINANFKYVRFKLFDFYVTTGELKPTCEATLNGVPYQALSKGEKLKAALDIFNAIQNHFGTELPLIIDDAESYTSNSFIELPNQIFFFKVSDEDLMIAVEERRRAS